MDILWAPWRMEYILSDKTAGCVFCAALAQRAPCREDLVLHAGAQGAVMMNRYPYGHAHLLVVPYRHTADFETLSPAESTELTALLQLSTAVLKDACRPQGFNLGMNLGQPGGAGILDHLHWHVLPRWPGDVNALALIGEVKSIPEHILATYDTLRAVFAAKAT